MKKKRSVPKSRIGLGFILVSLFLGGFAIAGGAPSSAFSALKYPSGYSPVDMSFTSLVTMPGVPFNWGSNLHLDGTSFPVVVDHTIEINAVWIRLSDRAYDPNNVTLSLETTSGMLLATGTISEWGPYGQNGGYPAIQLSSTVTLTAGVQYQMAFSSLPSTDYYGGMPGIAEDAIQEGACGDNGASGIITSPCVPLSAAYLGQSQWPVFSLGLMNLQPTTSGLANFNYGSYTDLEWSPGYTGSSGTTPPVEGALRFLASQNEQLLSFEVMVIGSDTTTNPFIVTLRPDATGDGHHPAPASSALATESVTMARVSANLSTAYPTEVSASSAFIKFNFPSPQLTAGRYYWLVMASPSDASLVLGRLVNPYREYYINSVNDFASGAPPGDGPTDIGFKITTTGEVINNAIIETPLYESDFSGMAQSFSPTQSVAAVKGVWVFHISTAGNDMIVSIQTDSGHDSPSGSNLTWGASPQGNYYVSFNSPATLTAGVKYWLVVQMGPCLQSSCSSPPKAYALEYRSDMYNTKYDYGGSALHFEVSVSGSAWTTPANLGDMTFQFVTLTGHENDPIWTTTTSTTSSAPVTSTTTGVSISTTLSTSTSTGQYTTATSTITSTRTTTFTLTTTLTSSTTSASRQQNSSINWNLLTVAFALLIIGVALVVF